MDDTDSVSQHRREVRAGERFAFVEELAPHDIVHSWGVPHHIGAMRKACSIVAAEDLSLARAARDESALTRGDA
jgi:hypothetical protein